MLNNNQGLFELHKLLRELTDVRDGLARGPRMIKAREQLLAQAEAELAAKQEEVRQLKMASDRKSLDLKTNDAKLIDLECKLNASTAPREYEILKNHLQADRVANSVLQDEILEYLDRVDRMLGLVTESQAKVQKAKDELQRVKAEVEKEAPGLRDEAGRLDSLVKSAEAFLSGDTQLQYRRLVESHGADALAECDRGTCLECNVTLTNQMQVFLNSGTLMFCPSCGRLLYVIPRAGSNSTRSS